MESNGADAKFMQKNEIPSAIEAFLENVVAQRDERPYEVLSWSSVIRPAKPPKGEVKSSGQTSGQLASLDFDVFSFDPAGPEMLYVVRDIFAAHNLLVEFAISDTAFMSWIATVRANYHEQNPFHNFRHAVNVLQTLHVFLTTYEAKQHFSGLEIFAMLFAAINHDLQHLGVNNLFLQQTLHPLAVRYCDHAVLEQHHCAAAFAVLELPGHDITAALKGGAARDFAKNERFRDFRADVIACVLGTEVAAHKTHVQNLRAVVEAGFNPADKSHRRALMVALVEAADVSNEARSFAFSRQWAPLVQEEFFQQGDRQRKLGIPLKPMNDRDVAVMSNEQVGFIKFLCLPLYEELAKVVKGVTFCVHNLQSNSQTWAAMSPAPATPPN